MAQAIPTPTNTLETIAILETNGYTDEDIPGILDIYEHVRRHIGFTDERRDDRFIVKFHDVIYCTPDDAIAQDEFDNLFDMFCDYEYEYVKEALKEQDVDEKYVTASHTAGHYYPFRYHITSITEENALELAQTLYDEYEDADYIDKHVAAVNILYALEQNYFEDWLNFLEGGEYVKQDTLDSMRRAYDAHKSKR